MARVGVKSVGFSGHIQSQDTCVVSCKSSQLVLALDWILQLTELRSLAAMSDLSDLSWPEADFTEPGNARSLKYYG